MSLRSDPLQEGGAPGQARAKTREQDVIAGLDPALPNGFLEGERDRCARGVAVFVDVDRDALDRKTDATRGCVDDSVVGLVRNPEIDLIEPDPSGLTDLGRLADEDVDRELEHVRTDHVDVRLRVLGRVGAFFDVAARDLAIASPVRAQTPAEKSGALDCRTRSVCRDLEGRRARLGDVAAVDARALGDPLVGCFHHLFEVEVRDHLRGRVDAYARDGAGPSLGLERAERHGVGPCSVTGRNRHRYASNRSAVFCSRNFHKSAMTFIFSSSSSGSSTSYLSSIAAISSTRSSESAARSR